jgi:hypothetical protein
MIRVYSGPTSLILPSRNTCIALVAAFSIAATQPAAAESWLLKRLPVVAASVMGLTALAAAHAIRDTLPHAIATYGSLESTSIIETVRGHLSHHKIVGPNAAIDTAARVVKAHPELMANSLAVLQALALPMAAFEARLAETGKNEAVAVDETDNQDESKCPEPAPARPGNRPAPAAYQFQVTGLDPTLAIFIDGTEFDGCRQADGTLLEAKGSGFAKFIPNDLSGTPSWYIGEERMTQQAERQAAIAIAHSRKLEWHFAEKLASEYYGFLFSALPNARMIKVIYDPPL